MWRRLGIGFLALLATFLVTMGLIQILLTCYRLNIDVYMTKELFLMLTAGEFVFFYHHMMRRAYFLKQ